MAATKTVITELQARRLEQLVRFAHNLHELERGLKGDVAEILGPDAAEFVGEVFRGEAPLAWMLERLGIEVA